MRSNMIHDFSRIPSVQIQRSSFDRSHNWKGTMDSGYLIPVLVDEVLPGDSFSLKMSAFARLATPIKPVMDNMRLKSYFFFVPNRLIWDHWNNFMGEREDKDVEPNYLVPYVQCPAYGAGGIPVGHLYDYIGIPTGPLHASNTGLKIDNLWGRAYNLIWNEWFMSEALQDKVAVSKDDGPDNFSDFNLLRKCKSFDMFTGALPYPQKGPDVLLPLGTRADVKGIGPDNQVYGGGTVTVYETGNSSSSTFVNSKQINVATNNSVFIRENGTTGYPDIWADLSNATAATINALRQAFQIQKFYERDARNGTRYIEIVYGHFGVLSDDLRITRSQYLGGGRTDVNIHPIAQTSASPTTPTGNNAQGNLSGFGTASIGGHSFTHSFTEHGVILGLVAIEADLNYQQNLDRMFSRRTKFDFYWPEFSHLGEQAILSKEIFCDGSTSDDSVFGYNERFCEYRFKTSKITGKFRSSSNNGLDIWHLAQDFGSTRPTLGNTFIQENPPISRIIAVPSEPQFLLDCFFNMTCARPMPVYGVPGLIDHF